MNYTPIHCHSHYSLLDGLSKPDQITKRLDQVETEACALTDHGSVSGAIQFLDAMKEAKKKPILGCELYTCRYNAKIQDETNRSLNHLLVYAKNDQGWLDLIRLVSEANEPEHFYYRPRLSLDQIAKYAGNLMVVSGHLGTDIAACIQDEKCEAEKLAEWFRDTFGKDNFFLECQLIAKQAVPEMVELTDAVRSISNKTGIPIVATPDAHYAFREQAVDQRILLCRNLGSKTLQEVQESGTMSCFFECDDFHIPTHKEMIDVGHTEEELDNTNLFTSCISEYKNILKSPVLPEFPCPKGYDADTWLRQLCRDGWMEKIQNSVDKTKHQEYINRVERELGVLQGAGLSSYFLIVQDIVDYVARNGWLPGPGRGSAAGCLVSYLIDITQIDPMPYDLLFERFYNAGRNTADRISMPDIDIDVPTMKREQVLKYIRDNYGHDHVSQMITYQTMQGRGALKDVLRAYGMSFGEMNTITQLLPEKSKIADELQQMKKETGESSIIRWALENDDKGKFKDWCSIEDGKLVGPYAKRFEQAIRLEGTKSSQSIHPAGVVIAPIPLHEMCPMIMDTKNKVQIAGLEMEDLEAVGCIKFDILGVAILDKIQGVQSILLTGDIND